MDDKKETYWFVSGFFKFKNQTNKNEFNCKIKTTKPIFDNKSIDNFLENHTDIDNIELVIISFFQELTESQYNIILT